MCHATDVLFEIPFRLQHRFANLLASGEVNHRGYALSTHQRGQLIRGVFGGEVELNQRTLFIGVYPGLSAEMLAYVTDTITAFARR